MTENEDGLIPCPALNVCKELGTATEYCAIINQLTPSPFTSINDPLPRLHNAEIISEEPETPDLIAETYETLLNEFRAKLETESATEIRRVHNKLDQLQCCLASIVLLLARKSK